MTVYPLFLCNQGQRVTIFYTPCASDQRGIRMPWYLFCLCMMVTCGTADPSWATGKGYAVNNSRIVMRHGPATSFKIVQMLKIGEEVEILESDLPSGWDRVHVLRSGLEGWVLHRFISTKPPPRIQLNASREAERLAAEERDRLRIELETLRQQMRSQAKLEAELARIRKVSHNALEIERQNGTLSQKVRRMEKEITRLADDNRILAKQADTSFFLAGAAVLIVGLIGGAVLTRRQRSSPFGSLE